MDTICEKCGTLVPYSEKSVVKKKHKGKIPKSVECFQCLYLTPIKGEEGDE